MAEKPVAEKPSKFNKGSVIKPCTCLHPFQDKEYGRGMRVKNYSNKGPRCTVCGSAG